MLLAFLAVLSMWLSHDKLLDESTPKYLAVLTVGVTIDAHFDYHDSITITETTITILSLSWHTIMILSRYYQGF